MLNPMHLKTFLAVLRTGSFADAGRELDYSASAVSQQMSLLERSTGLCLFEREAHSVRATTTAKSLSNGAIEVLTSLLRFEDQAASLASGDSGRVKMASFPSAGASLVPRALATLLRESPGIEVVLNEGEPDLLFPLLLEGDLDLMLAYEYSVVPREWPTGLTRELVLRENLLLVAPADLAPRSGGVERGVRAFADENWVSSDAGTGGALCLERLCASEGFSPRIAFRSNNYETVVGIVASGLGVALVRTLAYRPVDGVFTTPLDPNLVVRSAYAVHRIANSSQLLETVIRALKRAALVENAA